MYIYTYINQKLKRSIIGLGLKCSKLQKVSNASHRRTFSHKINFITCLTKLTNY